MTEGEEKRMWRGEDRRRQRQVTKTREEDKGTREEERRE